MAHAAARLNAGSFSEIRTGAIFLVCGQRAPTSRVTRRLQHTRVEQLTLRKLKYPACEFPYWL